MADLRSVCELAWRQLFPNPGDETAISKEEFIATGKTEYSYQMWLKSKAEKREEGTFEVPSFLLTEITKEVVDNEMDLTDLKILRSLDRDDQWLVNVGGMDCGCMYVKTTANMAQILCDEDSLGSARRFYVLKKKIKFPDGTHKKSLPIIYASNGENTDDNIEVDDAIAGVVRRALIDIYGGKTGKEDETNDSNSGQ